MGTRHLQIVINKNGVRKVSQYGQWDGYPQGQGVDILNFLKTTDLEKYQTELEKIHEITEEEARMVNKCNDWATKYPYLSRDCGSRIHYMILNGDVEFIAICTEEEARKWCEGFYTIDFQKGEFISEYYNIRQAYKLTELPTEEEYLRIMEPKDDEG